LLGRGSNFGFEGIRDSRGKKGKGSHSKEVKKNKKGSSSTPIEFGKLEAKKSSNKGGHDPGGHRRGKKKKMIFT